MLRDQNEDLKREVADTNTERDKSEQELELSRKTKKDLKSEAQNLRFNLREYSEIMEKQQQQKLSTQGQVDSDTTKKIQEKNTQISDLLTQITQIEDANRRLEENNRQLKAEMETGEEEMEKLVVEYEKMKKVISSSDYYADDLHRQNSQLKIQLADIREELVAKKVEEDAITKAVNEKVEMWSRKLRERDQENSEQAQTIALMREKIAAASLDQDHIKIERLTKRVKDYQDQTKQLQDALTQAVTDLEEQTEIVEDLRKDSGTNREILGYKAQIRQLQGQVQSEETKARDAVTQRTVAEEEAQENDNKLTDPLRRISLLESGVYGLPEAVNEIKDCKAVIRTKDNEVQELTKHAGILEEKINDLLEENEEFRERLGVDPRDLEDIVELRKSRALRQQQYRAENQVLLKEIERLEDERLE
jgi:centrosomal protein CEP290